MPRKCDFNEDFTIKHGPNLHFPKSGYTQNRQTLSCLYRWISLVYEVPPSSATRVMAPKSLRNYAKNDDLYAMQENQFHASEVCNVVHKKLEISQTCDYHRVLHKKDSLREKAVMVR